MYFPYLRGKQFELIALREIFNFLGVDNRISPIIEPVKETTVTLEKTLTILIQKNQNFNFILNPSVGDLCSPMRKDEVNNMLTTLLSEYGNFQPTFIIDERTHLPDIITTIRSHDLHDLTIICNNIPQNEAEFFEFVPTSAIRYIIINEGITSRGFVRQLNRLGLNKVALTDSFKILKRNVDYVDKDDEFFSDEHVYYHEEGFAGFSDYLTIGQEYSDTGFLPFAVAIHLTYQKDNAFWIRHFVSDSNEDKTDVAGKFSEALAKLIAFIDRNKINTYACKEFRRLHETETYPGLGSVKKLSILHHIELVNNYLINAR